MENNSSKSMKEKFDKAFPEAKMLREHELRKSARDIFFNSTFGKNVSVVFFLIGIFSIFVYWKSFEINFFLSIILGIITCIVATSIFSKIFIKILGIDRMVRKINDEEIEASGKKLEETTGISMDKFLK
jgi:hypothetical protein